MKQAIVANSNIKETLDAHPELKQVLISLSPKFKRMQSAAVYNTLARFANFNDAAKITGLSVCEILHTINRHLGTEDMLAENSPQCIRVDSFKIEDHSVAIAWDESTDHYIYSERMISKLISKVIQLAPQKNLVIFSIEPPNELLKVANGLGHNYNLEKQREYRVSIFNPLPAANEPSWLDKKK
jgi:NitT/TauT family transport system substrate-binding protein